MLAQLADVFAKVKGLITDLIEKTRVEDDINWRCRVEDGTAHHDNENLCWSLHLDKENKAALRHVRILSMKDDGSVVKISLAGNYNAFMEYAEGCHIYE